MTFKNEHSDFNFSKKARNPTKKQKNEHAKSLKL